MGPIVRAWKLPTGGQVLDSCPCREWSPIPRTPAGGARVRTQTDPPLVLSATPERWPDVRACLTDSGGDPCWCMYWRFSSSEYSKSGREKRRAAMRSRVADGPAPGMLAYVDGQPVGWLGLGPRPSMERLVRSRTIPLIDDRPVWSIVCFLVRVGFRRQGVARALLDGAIAYAREQGAPALEAYPVDPEGQRVDVAFGYVGFTPLFEAAGFQRVVETEARSAGRPRWLVRLELAP